MQPELLSALVWCTDSMLRQFGPQELSNVVWCLGKMYERGVPFTPDVDVSSQPRSTGLLWAAEPS